MGRPDSDQRSQHHVCDLKRPSHLTKFMFLGFFSEIGETVSVYVDWRSSSQPFGHYWFAVDKVIVVRPQNLLQLQLRVLR